MATFRAIRILIIFFITVLLLAPVQWLFVKFHLPGRRRLPHYFHKFICWVMGVRVHVEGKPADDKPVLMVANHMSWLDILIISSITPTSFVAKQEVSQWPGASLLARLQETIFVNRDKRSSVGKTAEEISSRLQEGDHILLFAEGTSSDGNRVLPFKSSLFAAAYPAGLPGGSGDDKQSSKLANKNGKLDKVDLPPFYVQTLAIAYTHMAGIPLGRRQRAMVAWYGDTELFEHVWSFLKMGVLDVYVRFTEPKLLKDIGDRKALAAYSEEKVRRDVGELLATRLDD